jgi:hypothetical protein
MWVSDPLLALQDHTYELDKDTYEYHDIQYRCKITKISIWNYCVNPAAKQFSVWRFSTLTMKIFSGHMWFRPIGTGPQMKAWKWGVSEFCIFKYKIFSYNNLKRRFLWALFCICFLHYVFFLLGISGRGGCFSPLSAAPVYWANAGGLEEKGSMRRRCAHIWNWFTFGVKQVRCKEISEDIFFL